MFQKFINLFISKKLKQLEGQLAQKNAEVYNLQSLNQGLKEDLNSTKTALKKSLKSKVHKSDYKHLMEFAFELGGKKYYRFKQEESMPQMRALALIDIASEMDMRVSKDWLKLYIEACNNALNQGKLQEIAVLTKNLENRLGWITDIALVYRFASVIFIEENENPETYDLKIAEKKIEFWQANEKDIESFFLKIRISELVPYLDTLHGNTQAYSLAQSEEKRRQNQYLSERLSQIDSTKMKKSDIDNLMQSLIQENLALLNLSK